MALAKIISAVKSPTSAKSFSNPPPTSTAARTPSPQPLFLAVRGKNSLVPFHKDSPHVVGFNLLMIWRLDIPC